MSESKFKKIGKYDVLDIIGRGGMGVIYKAIDPAIGRLVAIKMITGAYSEDPDLLKRFYREAQSTGTLQHPNIVTVYELGDLEGTPYLVMEFLDGEGLDKVISGKRPMPLVEKLAMAVEICHGLSYAHQKTVIHRDIKPANVIILRNGGIKIVDFGIARIGNDQLTKPGQVVGSIHYMSPEQINAIPVDARTDIFSTGVLLYELISYALPFQGRDTFTTLMKILNQEAAPLESLVSGLPPELNSIVQQALAKDRELRYASIDDLAFDLNRVLDRLKEEIISGYLSTAEKCIKTAEWAAAREQISLIFRIDRQHTKANMLNREITAAIQREQLQAQIREHRAIAERAYAQNHYDEALASLDQALALRKTDPTIIRFRDSVEAARSKAIKLADLLRRANAAVDAKDLEEAAAAIDDALAVDPENSEAKALQAVVRREREEREKQKQVENYLEVGRKQMSARQYTAAIEILKKAEELDPTAGRVHELINLAVLNQEQERRRKELEHACREVEEALNRDDYNTACSKAEDALKRFPGDRALLKLKALADKQKESGERRAFVDAQVKASRSLLDQRKSADAASLLEAALQRYPGDAALGSQLAMVREIIARELEEERKSGYIHEAKEALLKKDYDRAISILEKARGELKSVEIDDLLQFSREEAATAARQKKVQKISEDAQRLLDAEEFEAAGELLEKALAEFPEEELRILLGETLHAAEKFDQKVKDAIGTADRMVRGRRTADALKYLESMPASFSRVAEFRECTARVREEHCKLESFAAAKAEARTALDKSDFDRAMAVIDNSQTFCGDISEFADLRREIEAVRQTTAKAVIEKAIHDARLVLLVRSYDAALKLLQAAGVMLEYTSPDLRAQFADLLKDAQEGKERQEREAQHRQAVSLSSEQISTRIVGSSATTSSEDTLWAGAATATPIPQELTRLESGIVRERDLLKLRELLAKCDSASVGDCESIELQTESLSEMYGDDGEFQTIVSQILDRLAEIEQAAHTSALGVEDQPVEPELTSAIEPKLDAEIPTPPEPTVINEQSAVLPVPDEPIEVAEVAGPEEPANVIGSATEMPANDVNKVGPSPAEIIPVQTPAEAEDVKVPALPPKDASEKTQARVPDAGVAAPTSPAKPIPVKGGRKKSEIAVPPISERRTPKPITPTASPLPRDGVSRSYKKFYILMVGLVVAAIIALLIKGQFASTPKTKPMPASNGEVVSVRPESAPSSPAPPSTKITSPVPETPSEKQPESASPITTPLKRTAVEFVGAPPTTSVRIDGKWVGQINATGGLIVDVNPGMHSFELTRPGYQPLNLRHRVAADRIVRFGPRELLLQPMPAPVAQKSQPQEPPPTVATKTEPAPVPTIKTPPPPAPDPAASEWAKVSASNDPNVLGDFIRKFPNTPQAAEASRRLDQLRSDAARIASEKASADLAATRSAIEQTLSRYAQAYRNRDANAITQVWPGLNRQDLKKIQESFKAAKSVDMNLRPETQPEINGEVAQVVCLRSLQFTFPQGVQKPLQDRVIIHMRKQNGLWVIEKVQ